MRLRISKILTFAVSMVLMFLSSVMSPATEPITLTILTLDDRPPNNLLVKQLGAIAGIDLVVEFDPETASTADCVSLNAAVAGSLVGSRTADPWTLEPPELREDALVHFAVPRVQPTVLDQELIDEYSRIQEELRDPAVQVRVLEAIRDETVILDDEILAAYADRMRGWLDLLDRAEIDPERLLITLDDNRPGPLSDGLKLLLKEYSHYVYDGTDEGMMLLVARALRERQVTPGATCRIIWTDPGCMAGIQPFESGMVAENLLVMSDWLSLRMSPRIDLYEFWRPVLWLHCGSESGVESRIRETSESIGEQPVIVADVARTNGGDPALINTWRDGATPPGLIGYLAWNTSSNALGSALALWAVIDFAYEHSSDPEGVRSACETFLWARFIDDYIYQSVVRAEMMSAVRSEGGDPYHLTADEAETIVRSVTERLMEIWAELDEPLAIPLRVVDTLDHTRFVVELPWNRLFEIALYPTDDRGVLPVIRNIESTE